MLMSSRYKETQLPDFFCSFKNSNVRLKNLSMNSKQFLRRKIRQQETRETTGIQRIEEQNCFHYCLLACIWMGDPGQAGGQVTITCRLGYWSGDPQNAGDLSGLLTPRRTALIAHKFIHAEERWNSSSVNKHDSLHDSRNNTALKCMDIFHL